MTCAVKRKTEMMTCALKKGRHWPDFAQPPAWLSVGSEQLFAFQSMIDCMQCIAGLSSTERHPLTNKLTELRFSKHIF